MKFIIACLFLINSVYAERVNVYEYFINGINNNRTQAEDSAKELNSKLQNKNISETNMIGNDDGKISLLYNEQPELILPLADAIQILDAYSQITSQNKQERTDILVNIVMEFYGWTFELNSQEYNDLHLTVSNVLQSFVPTGENLQLIANDFEQQSSLRALDPIGLNSHKYFWIIAHSQGNLYANELINKYKFRIEPDPDRSIKHFSLLSIATPATKVEGYQWSYGDTNQQYVTSTKDNVIKIVLNSLPSNLPPSSSSSSHALVDYLTDYNLGSEIISRYNLLVDASLWAIKYNEPYVQQKYTTFDNYNSISYVFEKDYDNSIVKNYFLENTKRYSIYQKIEQYNPTQSDYIRIPNNGLYSVDNKSYQWSCYFVDDYVENCKQIKNNNSSSFIGSEWASSPTPVSLLKQNYYPLNEALIDSGTVKDGEDVLTNEITINRN